MARINKQIVLQAAAEMADTGGLESVTLKALANKLGIRSPSLYNHVKSLEDLRVSLMLYGWTQLENEIMTAAVGKSGDDAVKAICKTFMVYATSHPGVFNAMEWYNQHSSDEAMQTTERMVTTIFNVLSSYKIENKHKVHLVRMFRSFLQGFISITNNKGFGNPVSLQESYDFAIDIILQGLHALSNEQR